MSLALNHDVIKENVNSFLCLVFPFFIKSVFCSVNYWIVLAISSRYIDVTGLLALPCSLTLLLIIVAKVKK